MCREHDGLWWDTVSYRKHIKARIKSWERSWAKRFSEERGSASQFNPTISLEEIKRIELGCARGQLGQAIGRHQNSSTFFYEHDGHIGVSKGEFTRFLIVYRGHSGSVHGYPIPESELQDLIRRVRSNMG